MKKTISLWLMLLCSMSVCLATDYLSEENGYLLEYFLKSGTPSDLYLNCDQEIVTTKSDKKLSFTYGGNLTWYNIQAKAHNCWYVFSFGKFDLHYKLYYKEASKKDYTLCTEGIHYFVDNNITEHEAPIVNYEKNISVIDKKAFENTIEWNLPSGLQEGIYDFKLELSVSPNDETPTAEPTVGKHYENGADNIFCKYESAIKYINGNNRIVHTTSSHTNRSGGKTKIQYVNSNKTVIQGNSSTNPLNEEGYRLVYNHPEAIFNISLRTDNAPVDTIINNRKYDGYSMFLCGIGESYQLPSISNIKNEIDDCRNNHLYSSKKLRYFEFIRYTNPTIYNFIKKKYENNEYTDGASQIDATEFYGMVRFRAVLLQTINQEATLFNENAICKLGDYEKKDHTWFSRIYHVRDLWQAKLSDTQLNNHQVFKIWNKVYYSNYMHDVTGAMATSFYGPSYSAIENFCSNNENYPYLYLGENCLMFKLVPQVTFPALNDTEKQEVRVCATDDLDHVIHLVGKSIVCENTSPTLYSPHYIWQVSTNAVTWKNIPDNDPYRVNAFDLDSQVAVDSKDILLKSSILNNDKPLYFRQLCVLKSFSSTEESDLYNYPIDINGKTYYYISIPSTDYYTYRALSKPMPQNFGFIGYNWPEKTYLCHNEVLQENEIRFDLVKGINLSDEDLYLLSNQANYRIYEIDADGNNNLIANKNYYKIPTVQDSVTYQCVIDLCNINLSKTIRIYRHPKDVIAMHQITSSAAIAKADSINGYMQLWSLTGSTPSLTIKNNNVGNVYEFKSGIEGEDNTWKMFTQNIEGTTQLPYNENISNPTFYIRKTNANGCVSDSIKIDLRYTTPIMGNVIEFKHTESDTVFVPSGESNPYIIGSYPVTGGYGEVNQDEQLSYTYQWMRKSNNGEWEPIVINSRYYAQVTDSGTKKINSSTKYVSLPDETLKDMQENWEIARFVYSRKNGDINSQIVSVSNSLWMLSSPLLNKENIQVFNAECTYDKASVVVNEPDEYITKNTRYIWKASDPDLVLSTISSNYSNTDNKCIVSNAKKDFTLNVYRYDIKTGVRSNTVNIPINVELFNTGFTILFNNREYNLEEKLYIPAGSKIQLVNQSVNAEENLNRWVLQVQEDFMGDGRSVEGTTSNVVNPACYLYNNGQNKIKLTTTSKNGCEETVVAENIFVVGAEGRSMPSYFVDEDVYQMGDLWIQQVSPTLLSASTGYTISIQTNKQQYSICLYNLMGQAVISPIVTDGNYELSLHHLKPGYYLLQVDSMPYKIVKQ